MKMSEKLHNNQDQASEPKKIVEKSMRLTVVPVVFRWLEPIPKNLCIRGIIETIYMTALQKKKQQKKNQNTDDSAELVGRFDSWFAKKATTHYCSENSVRTNADHVFSGTRAHYYCDNIDYLAAIGEGNVENNDIVACNGKKVTLAYNKKQWQC